MKFLKLFIILILVFSCDDVENIKQFETALGKENSETLTYLVEDFENYFLKKEYPDINTNKAYEQFLIDLRDDKKINWQNLSKESRDVFYKSKLRLALYCVNDTVWIEKNPDSIKIPIPDNFFVIKTREKCLIYDGSVDYHINEIPLFFRSKRQLDSLINIEKSTVDLNSMGSYSNALQLITNKSEFLENYTSDRQSARFMPY